MMPDDFELSPATFRRAIYVLLIVTTLCTVVGRIFAVSAADRRTPFLSANDRSRWCTIREIVDSNTYAIDRLQEANGWKTIDKVRHISWDGKMHFYSSKPPLFPTLLASQYWLIKRATGATFANHPFAIGRTMLVITNVVPLLLYFWLLMKLVERWGTTDWGRVFVIAVAAWGTYLTTFAITLNNHLPAAICVIVVLYALIAIWYEQRTEPGYFILAGLAAGFAAANELPALSLLALLGVGLLWKHPRSTLIYFTPAVAVVVIAFFATNYMAHHDWRPAYAHREWYDYPDSYWHDQNRRGVDRGEPSQVVYALNVLIGHHGIFSLTPVWILSIVGLGMLVVRRDEEPMPAVAVFIATLTAVCLIFYLTRPVIDRNYGGVTSGFRWMFWFTPLWLFALIPVADRISDSPWLRRLAVALLAVSVLSAAYPALNPWQHPWPYRLAEYVGWIAQ